MSEVRVRENESLESALKRFKRSCAKSGVLAEGMTLVKSIVVKGKLVSLIFKPQA